MQVNNIKIAQFTQVIFEALQAFFLSLINKHLIYTLEVEQWHISALGLVTNEVRYFQGRRLIWSMLLCFGGVGSDIEFLVARSRLAISSVPNRFMENEEWKADNS